MPAARRCGCLVEFWYRPMAKKIKQRTFDDVVSTLGNEKFDVSSAGEGASRSGGARRVSKYGCAAEIAPGNGKDETVRLLNRGGWLLGGEIASLVDRGYQKFLKTAKLEVPATADQLRAIHRFNEEFKEAAGALVLYNEALGTTSDQYLYDRLKGREVV